MGDGSEPYIVTFDPLDGSSIVDVNWTVGTIFGIWKTDEKKLIGHKVSDQVSAGAVNYGSRTTVIFYNALVQKVQEWTLNGDEWVLTNDDIWQENNDFC